MIPSVKEQVDPLSEAKSQIWFIETFAKPLFDLTASGIPGQFSIFFRAVPFRLIDYYRGRRIREELHGQSRHVERKSRIAYLV